MKELPRVSFRDVVLMRLGFRTRYLVEGDSMLPLLEEGDEVMVNKGADVFEGDIVIARHPQEESIEMVKRVAGIYDEKFYSLLGDNPPESSDSREFGLVEQKLIIGKVICRIR